MTSANSNLAARWRWTARINSAMARHSWLRVTLACRSRPGRSIRFSSGQYGGRKWSRSTAPRAHSLLMTLVWAGLLAWAYHARTRYARGALLVSIAVVVILFLWLVWIDQTRELRPAFERVA
jgi:hypothetical protein